MKGMCNDCNKISTCKQLCKKAEKFANQDYVSANEGLAITPIENFNSHDVFGNDKNINIDLDNSAVLKVAIIKLYLDGKSTRKIAELVPCTFQYIAKIIQKYKKKLKGVSTK